MSVICSYCRRVKDIELDRWTDARLMTKEEPDTSHGACPRCVKAYEAGEFDEAKAIKMIYQKPLTEEDPEGMACLIEEVGEAGADESLELWRVRFVDDSPGTYWDRYI
ncbi:MAG: hypothetical protein KAT70_00070, partial [Thermoplasmata archaeon]|nr:hypothetical protein [Thermoplasmata archaeon]